MFGRTIFDRPAPFTEPTEPYAVRQAKAVLAAERLREETEARRRVADERRGRNAKAAELQRRIAEAEAERQEAVARLADEYRDADAAFQECEYLRLMRERDAAYLRLQTESLRLEQKVGRLRYYLQEAQAPKTEDLPLVAHAEWEED